jgi:hypothetical protein
MNHTLYLYQDERGLFSLSDNPDVSIYNPSQKPLGPHNFSPRELVIIQNFENPPMNTSQGDLFIEEFMHVYI